MERARREELPHIPFGSGICGHVAQTKEAVVIKDAYGVSGDFWNRAWSGETLLHFEATPSSLGCVLSKPFHPFFFPLFDGRERKGKSAARGGVA